MQSNVILHMKIDDAWKKVILRNCFSLGPQALKSIVLKLFFFYVESLGN